MKFIHIFSNLSLLIYQIPYKNCTFHWDKKFPEYYTQSEFTVRYIHFGVLNWLMSVIKLTYKILLFVKIFSSKDFSLILRILALIF